MSGKKSKTKGKTFEREIAKYLTDLYGENFNRVPNSGAFVGGKNAYRKVNMDSGQTRIFKGDIIPPDDFKYFVAECKHYKEFPFHRFFQFEPIPVLMGWIEQLEDCMDDGDIWLIFMKVTGKGSFVLWDSHRIFLDKTYSFCYNNICIGKMELVFKVNKMLIKSYSKYGEHLLKGI